MASWPLWGRESHVTVAGFLGEDFSTSAWEVALRCAGGVDEDDATAIATFNGKHYRVLENEKQNERQERGTAKTGGS